MANHIASRGLLASLRHPPPSCFLAQHRYGHGLAGFSTSRKVRGSGEAGDDKTGHIVTAPSQGVLFFNNLLPVRFQWLTRIPWAFERLFPRMMDRNSTSMLAAVNPVKVLKEVVSKDPNIKKLDVVEVLPRLKEGGAFVKFEHDESLDTKALARAVKDHLKERQIRPWWDPFGKVRAELVIGKPWVEDMFRLPSTRVKVEFLPPSPGTDAAELSQEQLYSFFRPYGKLVDIVPQPTDSKILPRFAYLDFARLKKAVMAKNCLHGYKIGEEQGGGKLGTIFRLTYEKKKRAGWIQDWLFSHPRIVIPALAALVAGLTVAIFDPFRTWSIKAHITRQFHIEDNVFVRWFKTQGEDLINKVTHFGSDVDAEDASMQVVWDDRQDEIERIQAWLMETADTFIIVQGPRGSGKRELVVDRALQHKEDARKLLVVDCKPIQEARGDAATISAAANEVGYRPVFSWMNSISGLLDLAAQGATGVKTGFSETLENQLVKIWNNTTSALKSVALSERKKGDSDINLSDDEWLEVHPESRPVVVIDNFLHKSNEVSGPMVYDKLAEWAAQLTTSNIAHVVFLTNDVSFTKSLSKALPDRVFRQISLGDCSPEVAKRYVISHLDYDANGNDSPSNDNSTSGEKNANLTPSQRRADLRELDEVIGPLGGRLTDLEFLARRIKAGETPSKAVREIVDQSASEVLKMYLLPSNTNGGSSNTEDKNWSGTSAWKLIKALSKTETLRFHEVVLDGVSEQAITALEQAELVSVQSLNGRPYSIKPGKPVYQPAFKRLTEDRVLAAKMDIAVAGEKVAKENKGIEKWETELRLIGELPKQPGELASRVQWLLGNCAEAQGKIEGLEREMERLKKVLKTEF
ncbi:hypothetical protein MBLNU230_g6500t1 [Neophaeotheca triangularis]